MNLTYQQQQIMQQMIRSKFESLDPIELTITGRQLINIAEQAGWIDLHTKLCESYNERTKTNGAEDARQRGLDFAVGRIRSIFNRTAA